MALHAFLLLVGMSEAIFFIVYRHQTYDELYTPTPQVLYCGDSSSHTSCFQP